MLTNYKNQYCKKRTMFCKEKPYHNPPICTFTHTNNTIDSSLRIKQAFQP